jgi:hypothetical protein
LRLGSLSSLPPHCLDVLGLLIIELSQLGFCPGIAAKKLVQLGVDRLRVAMLGPLNEQGHHPRRQGSDGMPVERLALKQKPEEAIGADDEKTPWDARLKWWRSQSIAPGGG